MSAKAGWYADPGGGVGLYRYWDGKAWSAATSPNPAAAPPPGAIGAAPSGPSAPGGWGSQPYGTQPLGSGSGSPSQPFGGPAGYPPGGGAYANYQQLQKKRSPIGWWIGAAALVVVIVVVAVLAIRAIGGGSGPLGNGPVGAPPSQDVCPPQRASTTEAEHPADGRVHGGPVSFPELGSPWSAPRPDNRVPFGVDVLTQWVDVEPQANWGASILVAELQAGDGFFTPEQGAQIVLKCVLGAFYGNNEVQSDVKVNKAVTIDGHDGWQIESQLSFDIPDLNTKGELLIVAIVATGATAGLYYASIPDSRPDLVPAARESLAQLQVDG